MESLTLMTDRVLRSLVYGDEAIPFQLRRQDTVISKIKIHVQPDASVIVEAPHSASEKDIYDALNKKARWILFNRNRSLQFKRHVLKREYISGETHFYLGRRHMLQTIELGHGGKSLVRLNRGHIEVHLPVLDPQAVKLRLKKWYQERAMQYFAKRSKMICESILWVDCSPPITLRAMEKQWGNCSPDGKLTLNPALIKAPRPSIDYVITHELCHLLEHNHSPKFYELLSGISPDWRAKKAELDGLAELLLAE